MRIHNYLEDLLGSKTKIAVLRVLFRYPSRRFTGRELARLTAGASKSSTLRIIRDLEASGIVRTEYHGRTLLVSLNREHILSEDLTRLFGEERKAFGKFIERLKQMVPSAAECCLLFGSVARGEDESSSDVDILVIVPDSRTKHRLEGRLPTHIKDYELALSWHIWTRREFKQQRDSELGKSIRRDAVLLKGENPWQNQRPSMWKDTIISTTSRRQGSAPQR